MRPTEKSIVKDDVVNRMIEEMNKNGISQKSLVDHLGLGNGTFTRWKYDGMKSYLKYIDQIADFLGVSKSYLLTGTDNQDDFEISDEEKEIVTLYRKMTKSDKHCLYKQLKGYSVIDSN